MAQAGFTPIRLYHSTTVATIPAQANLLVGEVAVNVTDKRLFTKDGTNAVVELGTNPSTIKIVAGSIDGAPIGATTPSTGVFTTISSPTGSSITYQSEADWIWKKTAGAEFMRLKSTGLLGIGTDAPAAHVTVHAATGEAWVQVQSPALTSLKGFRFANSAAPSTEIGSMAMTSGNELRMSAGFAGVGNEGFFTIRTSGTERLRIKETGNVGIGHTNPAYRLTVSDTGVTTFIVNPVAASSVINVGAFSNHALAFLTNNVPRMRMEVDGTLNLLYNTNVTGAFTVNGEVTLKNSIAAEVSSIIFAKPDATSNAELQLYGGDWGTDFNSSIPDSGVRLGGNYLALESNDISMRLPSAQLGSRVIVAGFTERGNAIIGAEAPPVPDFVAVATGTTDVEIYSSGAVPSTWVQICDTLTLTREILPNQATVYFEVTVESTGNKAGELELGIGLNGAVPTGTNSIAYSMGPLVKQIYASTTINANTVANGSTATMYARAKSIASNGFAITARNAERPSILKVSVIGSGGGGGGLPTGTEKGVVFLNSSKQYATNPNFLFDSATGNLGIGTTAASTVGLNVFKPRAVFGDGGGAAGPRGGFYSTALATGMALDDNVAADGSGFLSGADYLVIERTKATGDASILNASPTGAMLFGTGAGGGEKMRIDNVGRVGINMAPNFKFDVTGGINDGIRYSAGAAQVVMGFNGSTDAIFGTFSATPVLFTISGSEAVRIDTDRNVGIGASTVQGAGVRRLQVGSTGATTNIIVKSATTHASLFASSGTDVYFSRLTGSKLNIGTGPLDGSTFTSNMVIDADGKVGIGTTSPAGALAVQSAAGSSQIIISNAAGVTNSLQQLTFAENAQGTALSFIRQYGSTFGGTDSRALTFATNGSERMRIDSVGNFVVGATSGSAHTIAKEVAVGATILNVYGTLPGAPAAQFLGSDSWTPNVSLASMYVGKTATTGRSINASGSVNQAGADYAEYEYNRGLVIAAGSIVGFDAEGTLTLTYTEAKRFAIKSTNPGLVGGDTWGTEAALGTVKPDPSDTVAMTVFNEILETARANVDRVAYCGKVPVNVLGATVGGYIVAVEGPTGLIEGLYVADPDFAQYKKAVGRVNKILGDGRAEVAVIIH